MNPETGKSLWTFMTNGRVDSSPVVAGDRVFVASMSGLIYALSLDSGEVLWQYDTVQSYEAVNGARAHGGAIDGPGVVIADGQLYVTSGYAKFGGLPGNVLLAFSKGK